MREIHSRAADRSPEKSVKLCKSMLASAMLSGFAYNVEGIAQHERHRNQFTFVHIP